MIDPIYIQTGNKLIDRTYQLIFVFLFSSFVSRDTGNILWTVLQVVFSHNPPFSVLGYGYWRRFGEES